MVKKLMFVPFLFAALLALTACEPVATPVVKVIPTAQQSTPESSILQGTAVSGDSLASVFDRITGTDVGGYLDFGYLWVSQSRKLSVWFADKNAFVLGRGVIYLPDLWVGDTVYIGTRAQIAELANRYSDVEKLSNDPPNTRSITVSGGQFNKPLIFTLIEGNWQTEVLPGVSINAVKLANKMADGTSSLDAVNELLGK